jgi:phosphotransferase system enzyme I (PtsI)
MKGIGVSPGISIGKAFKIKVSKVVRAGIPLKNEEARQTETEKFNEALRKSVSEIETLKTGRELTQEAVEVLETQIEFLSDEQIIKDVHDKINNENKHAYDAVSDVISSAEEIFLKMDDEYLRARATDIRDIGNRILKNLNGVERFLPGLYPENTIIIAEDIVPSDAIMLDVAKIAGFATSAGGKTSHTAIIAKARSIPAVVACGKDLLTIEDNEIVIIDGSGGEVIIRPDSKTIEEYKIKQIKISEELLFLKSIKKLPAQTTDGHKIKLYANISDGDEMEKVFEYGGEGVGLFRTEMMFLGRTSFPSEEEQFEFYKKAAIKSKDKPLIVRTLDIGGDKQVPYLGILPETNPFLGYRAIRLCLDQKELFYIQLKAILRASIYGNLKIMLPMISNIDEIRQTKECLNHVKDELSQSGIRFKDNIELGIMIEIPSTALMIDLCAKEVDFFSIGTNDLCQYTLATDRMNEKVSLLYNYFNPGFLRLIRNVIEQAHKNNKPVGMCGEMASDPMATLLLLGMGLDEFSMSAPSIPVIKNIIIRNSLSKAREICGKVMELDNTDRISNYLREQNGF